MINSGNSNETPNWVDPDVIAYYEDSGELPVFDEELEVKFKDFFITEWPKPEYDDLRQSWDRYLNDESPHGRVLAKTALWSVVNLRHAKEKARRAAELNERLQANGQT